MMKWIRWNYLFALLWLIVAHLARVDWLIDVGVTCMIIHVVLVVFGLCFPEAVK